MNSVFSFWGLFLHNNRPWQIHDIWRPDSVCPLLSKCIKKCNLSMGKSLLAVGISAFEGVFAQKTGFAAPGFRLFRKGNSEPDGLGSAIIPLKKGGFCYRFRPNPIGVPSRNRVMCRCCRLHLQFLLSGPGKCDQGRYPTKIRLPAWAGGDTVFRLL